MRSSTVWGRRCALFLMLAAGGLTLGAVGAILSPNLVQAVLSFIEGKP